ncbi:hypothetical protein [Phenylobacterium sp.]|uniref:hypothetical protein n=1 Tax=Phenylobacterium sp. TaxID=1871053 RepID=UPI00122BA256|nr:hypothetical protein [Phenylobacterium sp.]THD55706.1 MAG: hypothetical protein E8A12_15735 [Phenylobacterium sp.]
MLTARRQASWAVAASVIAHLGVLTAVLLQHPTLVLPVEPSGPPQAIIPVLILPRTPPPPSAGRGARPAPIQLHQRRLRNLPTETSVRPLLSPAPKPVEAPAQAAPSPAPVRDAVPAPPPVAEAFRATLRTMLGCSSTALSRDERTRCQERLGRGAHDEPYLAQPLSKEKRAALDQAGAAKLADRASLERAAPAPGPPPPTDYSGDPYITGAGQSMLGPVILPPSKRAAPKLGPLPP